MNKGGFRKITTKMKPSITKEITFNAFSLDLIRDTIISKLPIWEMDAGLDAGMDFNRNKGKRKEKQSGGTNYFVEDFNSWLKIEADPVHDFRRKHQFDTKYLSEKLLIRTYHDILERTSTDFENSVLIKIIQDPNPSQGISLKYCRFYKIKSAENAATAENEESDAEERSLWQKLESNFDAIDRDSHFKFYILNAPISGTGTREFTGAYRKIVPLSAYWDPFKASAINFKIAENSDAFYDSLYDDICKELYAATRISFRLREAHGAREAHGSQTEKATQNILLIVHAPNGNTQTFPLNRQGFSVHEIKDTIEQMSNNIFITNDYLRTIIRFLAENGAKIQDVISFLLVCKMSGDVGCVYFLRNVAMPRKTIKAQYQKQPVIDFNVKNKPIMFLYTTDRLCGAIAIANDVKCVIKYRPLSDMFLCQYVGGSVGNGSNGANNRFDESVFEPYYEVINGICGYDLSLMSRAQKKIDLPKIYIKQFNMIFMNKTFNLHDIPDLHGLDGIREASDDDIIKYIIAIISLKDLKDNLENTLKYIVRAHFKAYKAQKGDITLLSISHIKALYNTLQKDGFFDPLLQYFMTTLIIPNEDIQKYVYNYISKKIKEKIGISLTDNYKMINVLKQPLPETQNVAINENEEQQENLDVGMTDLLPAEGSKESKKRAPKLSNPPKPKE